MLMPSVIMLSITIKSIMLKLVMLIVIKLSVFILNVVAPKSQVNYGSIDISTFQKQKKYERVTYCEGGGGREIERVTVRIEERVKSKEYGREKEQR